MTWLPISLKNAAKCDKWYQLQNHSITESLNAKGAREKLFTSHTRAYRILSVERTCNAEKQFSCGNTQTKKDEALQTGFKLTPPSEHNQKTRAVWGEEQFFSHRHTLEHTNKNNVFG